MFLFLLNIIIVNTYLRFEAQISIAIWVLCIKKHQNCFAKTYFRVEGVCNLADSTCVILRYHIGTAATNSFVVTLFWPVQLAVDYMAYTVKKYHNKCLNCIIRCMKWILKTIEEYVRFLGRISLIICSITGRNYCSSSRRAFRLLRLHTASIFVVQIILAFLMFCGQICIVGVVTVTTYQVVKGTVDKLAFLDGLFDRSSVDEPVVPAVIVGISSYVLTSLFFKVYTIAVNTMFICFMEDKDGRLSHKKARMLKLLEGDGHKKTPAQV